MAADTKAFTTDTPAQLEAFEQKALQSAAALGTLAPSSLKPAIATLLDEDQKVFAQLKSDGFDFSKIKASDLAGLNTPAVTKAESQVAAYLSSACGISSSG